jgi:hypothetical protein
VGLSQSRGATPEAAFLAGELVRKQQRGLVDPGEDPQLQMNDLHIETTAALRFLDDLVNHADSNGGRRRLKPNGEETTFLSGFARAIFRQSSGE